MVPVSHISILQVSFLMETSTRSTRLCGEYQGVRVTRTVWNQQWQCNWVFQEVDFELSSLFKAALTTRAGCWYSTKQEQRIPQSSWCVSYGPVHEYQHIWFLFANMSKWSIFRAGYIVQQWHWYQREPPKQPVYIQGTNLLAVNRTTQEIMSCYWMSL